MCPSDFKLNFENLQFFASYSINISFMNSEFPRDIKDQLKFMEKIEFEVRRAKLL